MLVAQHKFVTSIAPLLRSRPSGARQRAIVTLLLCVASMAGEFARADVVTDWNVIAIQTFQAGNFGGNPAARGLAIIHVAMSDAINTVQNRYSRYALTTPANPSASAEAAAVAAARAAIIALVPSQKAKVDDVYNAALARIPDSPGKTAGIAIGEQAAAAVIADRAADATNVPDAYRPATSPGVWVPTTPPLFAEYARAKPWVLARADQFRPGPPPALASAAYAKDYNETKDLGGTRSTTRTPAQTDAVKFWTQGNLGVVWFQVAQQLSAARGLDLADNARFLALLSMASANSFIVDWDAKFTYNFWRPVTAIRNGDIDGNDATERDAGWTPLNATPMHPEYPSQAAIGGAVAAGIIEAVFGTMPSTPVVITDSVNPAVKRPVANVPALVEECRLVRVWGGIHFRSSLEASDKMGREIAANLHANALRPVP